MTDIKLKHVLLLAAAIPLAASAQTELTYTEAKTLYANKTKKEVSIHDPSVVYDQGSGRYYIFGSHRGCAYSTDMQNWTSSSFTWQQGTNNNAGNDVAFVTPAVTAVKKGGATVALPAFNAMDWSKRSDASYDINGNMWAPDVIWNPTMNKWCQYLSINGDAWHSSIILLTADNITGPYLYQGPVVTCGFYDTSHSYKETDLEIVLGEQSALPSRYNVGTKWGERWPHTIDPNVFFDEEGKLWLCYGSWSGGIWMLELDEETGLRDYDVEYPSVNGSSNGVTSDPYFGKKIAGGYYVSGEGPYIEHIGNWYYLFVSYGFFSPDGGYEMRVFRSDKPDGPYKDSKGKSAIFTSYAMNYGKNGDTRGGKLMGAYNGWGFQTVGECAQGHNSAITTDDGRAFLVCHTKFNDGTAGHQVRAHQLFTNSDGWLVASPFRYNGEMVTDADIASAQPFTAAELAGTYKLLIHKYGMDYANYEEVTPIEITLSEDGKITGGKTGTWTITEGTGYISLVLGGIKYNGVVTEEVMDGKTVHTVSVSASAPSTGTSVWAYKMSPKYDLAWQLNNQTEPLVNKQNVMRDIDLYSMDLKAGNVKMTWTSSNEDVISPYGKYNPTGLQENTYVDLSVRLETPGWYWEKSYTVNAYSEANALPTADWQSGMVAYYGFNDDDLADAFDSSRKASLLKKGTNKVPTLSDDDPLRTGNYVHLTFGANGNESYVAMPNPLLGQELANGATISFWVKRTDNNSWDALFGLTDGTARLYMTGNTYIGYNAGNAENNNWIDINHPNDVASTNLGIGTWNLVTLVFTKSSVTMYVDSKKTNFSKWNGVMDGKTVTTATGFDYSLLLDLLSSSAEICLGKGSFWGSPDAMFDDFIVYNRALSISEVMALGRMETRVFDFYGWATGIEAVTTSQPHDPASSVYYDLQGRRLSGRPARGLYIKDHKIFKVDK